MMCQIGADGIPDLWCYAIMACNKHSALGWQQPCSFFRKVVNGLSPCLYIACSCDWMASKEHRRGACTSLVGSDACFTLVLQCSTARACLSEIKPPKELAPPACRNVHLGPTQRQAQVRVLGRTPTLNLHGLPVRSRTTQ